MSDIKQLAKIALTSLEHNSDGHTTLIDDPIDWVYDMVCEVHDGMLPDDYVFNWIESALDYLSNDDDEDGLREAAENDCTNYYAELLQWLSSNTLRIGYVDEAREEYGSSDSVMKDIEAGMASEAIKVFEGVRDYLEDVENE